MILLKNGRIEYCGELVKRDVLIVGNLIKEIGENLFFENAETYDLRGAVIIPGAVDAHVHLREPGFEYKETVKSGTLAAAKGGVTAVIAMPNTSPVIDSEAALVAIEEIIARDASVRVYPLMSITRGEKGEELSDFSNLSSRLKGVSDDGKGVNNEHLLKKAMLQAKECGLTVLSHTEADGESEENAESVAVERECSLALSTEAEYHFCHLSTKRSFDAVRRAKELGAHLTAEVTPHHLFLNKDEIKGNTNFKMNPPLRSEQDRKETVDALLSGVADMIATDHAPHSEDEKARPYDDAPNGIIGLETLVPLVYTKLVKSGLATLGDMTRWITVNPARRFGIPYGDIKEGGLADITAIDVDEKRIYKKEDVVSLSKNSPFFGETLYGFPILTMVDGKVVYFDK